jgi:hypothetical protein
MSLCLFLKALILCVCYNGGSIQDGFLLHTNCNCLQLRSINSSLSMLNITTHTSYITLQVHTAQLSQFQPNFLVTHSLSDIIVFSHSSSGPVVHTTTVTTMPEHIAVCMCVLYLIHHQLARSVLISPEPTLPCFLGSCRAFVAAVACL